MAKDLNDCKFIGRLGKDHELRFTPQGTAVLDFSLAVGDDYKDKQGEKHEQTEWVAFTAFGKSAEILAQYSQKGSKLYVGGKFKTESWEKDGEKKYRTKILVNDFQFLDSKQEGQQKAPQQQSQKQAEHKSGAPCHACGDTDPNCLVCIPF